MAELGIGDDTLVVTYGNRSHLRGALRLGAPVLRSRGRSHPRRRLVSLGRRRQATGSTSKMAPPTPAPGRRLNRAYAPRASSKRRRRCSLALIGLCRAVSSLMRVRPVVRRRRERGPQIGHIPGALNVPYALGGPGLRDVPSQESSRVSLGMPALLMNSLPKVISCTVTGNLLVPVHSALNALRCCTRQMSVPWFAEDRLRPMVADL